MSSDVMSGAALVMARITPKTIWIFVTLQGRSGLTGVGEATTQNREEAVLDRFRTFAGPAIAGKTPSQLIAYLRQCRLLTLPDAAVASALDQAAWDLIAQKQGVSVAVALGGEYQGSVQAYANINRRTLDRSPEGFAQSAADAVASGHNAIKIAPFDMVTPQACRAGTALGAVKTGLERIRKVRETIGDERRLMIDCHWRLDRAMAAYVIDAAAELGLYWVECPLQEDETHLTELKALRSRANSRGIRLAGCEEMTRLAGFAPFLEAGAYDVIMPDAKYAGGLEEYLQIAAHARRSDTAVSPHNPSGPVCHAASLQLCAAMGKDAFLEMQFDESPLFQSLQRTPLPLPNQGEIKLLHSTGQGLALDADILGTVSIARHVIGQPQ
jgi:galactonate dehydratase